MKFCKKIAAYLLVFVLLTGIVAPLSINSYAYSTDYPNTWTNTGEYIEDLIGIAMTQVGYHGNTTTGTKYGAWYGENFTYEQWCGMFIAWCANEAGIPTSIIHKTAKANNYRNSGTYYHKEGFTPKRGDLVLFNPMTNGYTGSYYWPEKNADGTYKESSHVAIVCSYDSKTKKIWIVHGNSTDDKVCFNSVLVSSDAVQAFVRPSYSGSSGSSGGSSEPLYDYINGDSVNLRSGPGTEHSKIASYDTGTCVEILDTVTNASGEVWYQVEILSNGKTGYIISDYITIINKTDETSKNHYINGDNVRLRSGPGTSFDEIDKFDKGTKVTLLGVSANADDAEEKWYSVRINTTNDEGYVRSDFIKIVTHDQTPYINDDNVNLRSKESVSGDSLGKFSTGEKLEVLSTVTNSSGEKWCSVIVFSAKVQGFIRSDFITVDEAPAEPLYDYTNTSYNLRSAPGTWNDVVGAVASNVRVYILEAAYDTDGDKWYYVRVASNGLEGYIYHKRVTINSKGEDTIAVSSCSVVSAPGGSTVLCTAKKGDEVSVLNLTYDGKGVKWMRIKITKGGTSYTGYVKASDVALNGVNRKSVAFTHKLETPLAGSDFDIDDTIAVRGWAFANVGEAPCFYSVDGGPKTPLTVEARTDVKNKYSACPSKNVGFAVSLSAKSLSYGEHTVEIFASTDVTVQNIYTVTFNIADGESPIGNLSEVADINSSGYTVVVAAQDNVGISAVYTSTTVNGKTVEHIAGLIADSVYAVRVKTADFESADADYQTKVYVRDTYNNVILLGEFTLNPQQYVQKTVVYDANGGTGAPETAYLAMSGRITLSDITPTKEGYAFMGWSAEKDGEVEYKAGEFYVFKESVTLYAVWNEVLTGDCNMDGAINTVDLALMKLALSGSEQIETYLGDINKDSFFDTTDLALLKLYLAGIKIDEI
ncbi:MAG: SH3 domain-containing protein [Clostridia bacterium]|nr:SH3 domain-containing protein [Clostridia bacterium]